MSNYSKDTKSETSNEEDSGSNSKSKSDSNSDSGFRNSKTSNPSSNFIWLAGTGGFFGALIYFLGKPENGSEQDPSVKRSIHILLIYQLFNLGSFRIS